MDIDVENIQFGEDLIVNVAFNCNVNDYAIVNVEDLNRFVDGAVVDMDVLLAAKIVRKPMDGLKVLGNGELTKKLTVKAAVFSATAKAKIEAAGGQVEEG